MALTLGACAGDPAGTAPGDGQQEQAPAPAPAPGDGGENTQPSEPPAPEEGAPEDGAPTDGAPEDGAEAPADQSDATGEPPITVVGPDGAELEPGWTQELDMAEAPLGELEDHRTVPASDSSMDGVARTNEVVAAGPLGQPYAWSMAGDDATLVEHDHDGNATPVEYTLETETDIGLAEPLDMMAHPDSNADTIVWTAGSDQGIRLMQLDPNGGAATEVASTSDGPIGEDIVGVSDFGIVTQAEDGALYHATFSGETTDLGVMSEPYSSPGNRGVSTAAADGPTVLTTRATDVGIVVEAVDVDRDGDPRQVATIEGEGLVAGGITYDEGYAVVSVHGENGAEQAAVLDVEGGTLVGIVDAPGTSVSGAVQDESLWITAATVGGEVEPTATDGGMWRFGVDDGAGERWFDEPTSGADATGGLLLIDGGLGGPGEDSCVISQGQ
ncbi:hypothetical protein ACPYO6_15695 [Georgenia sp. Z1344]|uniref:hypothetical protein n=1 Tax=Georgenia sp. Z1344 TaxID=3416706 RepID=UPI003CFAD807